MHDWPFEFLEPGPLIDGELELVEPTGRWVDALLEAIRHPLTVEQFPAQRQVTRQQLLDFADKFPRGRQPADPETGIVPAYHLWMRLRDCAEVPIRIAGGITLRIGTTRNLVLYAGHVGYHVYPPARGRHYAERSARLLLPLAARHGLREVWITCNPDNLASRRTCEGLGGELIEIVDLPPDNSMYLQGERRKCRYRIPLRVTSPSPGA